MSSQGMVRDKSLLPFIDSCSSLTEAEKQVLKLFLEGSEKPWSTLGIPRSTYYYRLRRAYRKLKQCLAGETGGDSGGEQGRRRSRGGGGSRDPDKAAVQQSLKEVASVVGKWSAEQMREVLEIGIAFYSKFRYIHEVLGIPWEQLIDILYTVFIEHSDEVEVPYLEILEHELMEAIARAIEEIEV